MIDKRTIAIAKEWARELGKFKGHEMMVADEALLGFSEVHKGRNPDTVLKEILSRIKEKIESKVSQTISEPSRN